MEKLWKKCQNVETLPPALRLKTWTVKLLLCITALIAVSFFAACHRVQSPDKARLTPTEIRTYERNALEGDAGAAKRLEEYYSGPGMDSKKAERWESVYDTLHRQKETSTPH